METKKKLKDGGLAIIDQWIAAHARSAAPRQSTVHHAVVMSTYLVPYDMHYLLFKKTIVPL